MTKTPVIARNVAISVVNPPVIARDEAISVVNPPVIARNVAISVFHGWPNQKREIASQARNSSKGQWQILLRVGAPLCQRRGLLR